MATNTNQAFQDCIQQYINDRAEADTLFAVKVANPSKSISECCQYIASEIYKMGVNGVDDLTVYNLAVDYFEEDNVEVNDKLNYKAVCNHHVELTDEEKAEARQKAIDQLQREEADRLRRKAERPKAQPQQAQPSLFDF